MSEIPQPASAVTGMCLRLRQRRSRSPTSARQRRSGTLPGASPGRSMPVVSPRPSRWAILCSGWAGCGVRAGPSPWAHPLQRLARLRVEVAPERVEEDVGGDLDGAREADRAVHGLAGVAELLLRGADLDAARVVDRRARRDDALAQRGEG